jgi:hypothetical protein
MSDPFSLTRLIRDVMKGDLDALDRRFGDGIAATVEGQYCSVRKGDPEAPATPGFFITPELAVSEGDHVWYFDSGGYKLVLKNLSRIATTIRSGTWVPVLTADSPGNLAITYSEQDGWWRRVGDLVLWHMRLTTATFAYTTATGKALLGDLPFTALAPDSEGVARAGGWTKAGYTQLGAAAVGGSKRIELRASGSGSALAVLQITDMPTAGAVAIRASGSYLTADA